MSQGHAMSVIGGGRGGLACMDSMYVCMLRASESKKCNVVIAVLCKLE